MRNVLIRSGLFSLLALGMLAGVGQTEETDALPFSVTIGGQKATLASEKATHGTISKPVSADAALKIGVKADTSTTIVLNIYAASDDGTPKAGSKPTVIILSGTSNGSLAGTLDGKKLPKGTYRMNAVASGKTAIVVFRVD